MVDWDLKSQIKQTKSVIKLVDNNYFINAHSLCLLADFFFISMLIHFVIKLVIIISLLKRTNSIIKLIYNVNFLTQCHETRL